MITPKGVYLKLSQFIKRKLDYIQAKLLFKKSGSKLYGSGIIRNPQYIKPSRGVRILHNFRIECYDNYLGRTYHPQLVLRECVEIGYDFTALVGEHIEIGECTIIASNVTILSESHGTDPESPLPYSKQPLETRSVKIGKGCWIGQNVVITPGVVIGDKCIIGANSVVTHDIPSLSVAAGTPAKVLKRYNKEQHRWETLTRL